MSNPIEEARAEAWAEAITAAELAGAQELAAALRERARATCPGVADRFIGWPATGEASR